MVQVCSPPLPLSTFYFHLGPLSQTISLSPHHRLPSSGQGRSSLEDWNSNVNQHQQQHQNGLTSDFNRLHNGSLTQPYNDPVRNGRNPPTTIPRLHSNSVSHSSRPFNGVGSSNAMQLDGNGSGNADGDEDMFESLIQEDSFE